MWHEEMKIVSSFLHNCFILPAAIDFFYFTVALSSKATPAHIFLRLKCDRKMSACYNRILVCVPMLRHIWFILIVKECSKNAWSFHPFKYDKRYLARKLHSAHLAQKIGGTLG